MGGIKMIAEFMKEYDFEHTDGGLPLGDFSNSWDWLMPVIKEIKDTHNLFEGLEFEWFVQTIEDAVWKDKVRLAYDAVVNIIEP